MIYTLEGSRQHQAVGFFFYARKRKIMLALLTKTLDNIMLALYNIDRKRDKEEPRELIGGNQNEGSRHGENDGGGRRSH
jgi:hypothetical protein